MSEGNPFESPPRNRNVEKKDQPGLGHAIYVHTVASLGSSLAFVGGFGAAFIIPTMVSQDLASSRQWVTILLVLGAIVGLICASLSYRATLRTYAKK